MVKRSKNSQAIEAGTKLDTGQTSSHMAGKEALEKSKEGQNVEEAQSVKENTLRKEIEEKRNYAFLSNSEK